METKYFLFKPVGHNAPFILLPRKINFSVKSDALDTPIFAVPHRTEAVWQAVRFC